MIQAALPKRPLTAKPVLGELELFGGELVGADAPLLVRADEAASFQHLQMLDEGWQRHLVRRGQLADRGGTGGEALKDIASCRIGQGPKDLIHDRRMRRLRALCAASPRCHRRFSFGGRKRAEVARTPIVRIKP